MKTTILLVRKPKAGMITGILKKYKLVSSNVVYVGDNLPTKNVCFQLA